MRKPSAVPTPTPALAPLFSPLEDVDDGDVSAAEDVDICDIFITVEEVGEAVFVTAGPVDVSMAEADMTLVISIVIARVVGADEERMETVAWME